MGADDYSPHCSMPSSSNETELLVEEANSCLRNHGGMFYDACGRKCRTEMSFLRLSQGLELEHVVYGHLFPLLVLFVVVANLLVALVLSQKHMVSPTNVVLKYMAIADLFYKQEERLELWWCYMYKYSMDAVPPVCHNVAMWLTVLLAGQRYISIQYPIQSRQVCSVRNVRLATLMITATSILCGLPKSIDYYFEVYEGWAYVEPGRLVYLKSCLSGFTHFVKIIGSNTFFNLYFWTRVFGFIMLPSSLLIVLNVLLIRGIRTAQRRKDRLLREKRAREAQRQIDSNSTSIMLVMIVSIFLVVNLPQAVFMAMLCVYNTFGISNSFLEGVFPITFLLVSNMLVMATYPINFGIYCFMSSSFRDTFRMLFCKKHWRHRLAGQALGTSTGFTRLSVVRRSDPSLQLSGRYSLTAVSDTGNGVSNKSSSVLPFPPLLQAGRETSSGNMDEQSLVVGINNNCLEDKNLPGDTIFL
uniref:G-protein coupled receptors family 1 profile domain-containing protein n=2 Tax=Ditylenchus dipsaci TaxID=166011 RepID=A0A915CRP7_9BILA